MLDLLDLLDHFKVLLGGGLKVILICDGRDAKLPKVLI